jgi:hypothetical protein
MRNRIVGSVRWNGSGVCGDEDREFSAGGVQLFPSTKEKNDVDPVRYPFEKASHILKLDTQGYEIEILKGAPKLLQQVEVVLLEASLIPINKGAPLFSDVVEFMSGCSFRLFDITSQVRRKDRVLWQTDLLFVREGTLPNLKPELTKENWG